jgi:hypothetical protein
MNELKHVSFDDNIDDLDRDSLHTLPLCILPIETTGLHRALLVKNVRLESVVELFKSTSSGSGQMEIEDLSTEFKWNNAVPHKDLIMIWKLGLLPSYGVYSLRISQRKMGINIEDSDNLKLSENKKKELASYLIDFTRPLISHIYGSEDMNIQSFADILRLFQNPDPKRALEKINQISEKLEIEPHRIPIFMENYGDMYLSLAYYRQCLVSISPVVDEFLNAMNKLRNNFQFKTDKHLMLTISLIEGAINERMSAITNRFENFENCTKHMWAKFSADNFRKVESLIHSYHISMGGVLCGLCVKMQGWPQLFPNKQAGGPTRRAAFILSEMKQGIDNMADVKDDGPMLSLLNEIARGD